MTDRHVLYRFYGDDGALLYIGITMNPGERFKQHRDDKPWWESVANITMERHQSREAVLAAERDAIIAESPLHNVTHNRGVQRPPSPRGGEPAGRLLSEGDYVALGLASGKCPVGYVDHIDAAWVTLILKSWLTGRYDWERRSYRLDDVRQICYAGRVSNGLVDDEHFAAFQSEWLAP